MFKNFYKFKKQKKCYNLKILFIITDFEINNFFKFNDFDFKNVENRVQHNCIKSYKSAYNIF